MATSKICALCGKDASKGKRIKDPDGNYFHYPCWEQVEQLRANGHTPILRYGVRKTVWTRVSAVAKGVAEIENTMWTSLRSESTADVAKGTAKIENAAPSDDAAANCSKNTDADEIQSDSERGERKDARDERSTSYGIAASAHARCPACGQIAAISPDGKRAKCQACQKVFILDESPRGSEVEGGSSSVDHGDRPLIPLVCPSCGGKLAIAPDKERALCKHCGSEHLVRHTAAGKFMLEPLLEELRGIRKQLAASHDPDGGSNKLFNCPECGATSVQKVSLAFELGASRIEASSIHVAGSGFGPVTGTTTTEGVQTSLLAQRLSPPLEKSVSGAVVGGFLAGVVFVVVGLIAWWIFDMNGFTFVVFALAPLSAIGGAVAAVEAHSWNTKQLPGKRREWDSQYVCMRCGNIFVPTET